MRFDTGWLHLTQAIKLEQKLLIGQGPPLRGWIPILYLFGDFNAFYPKSRITHRDFPKHKTCKESVAVTEGWANPLDLIPYVEGGVF